MRNINLKKMVSIVVTALASFMAVLHIKASAAAFGNTPVLTYMNDYGGRPQIQFTCGGTTCTAKLLQQDK